MTQRWLVIANPKAGGGTAARRLPALADALHAAGIRTTWRTTTAAEDARLLAADVPDGHDGILVVGGDGTINEVVNGLDPTRDLPLAIAAYGTGNDLARGLGLSAQPTAIAQLLTTAGQPRRLDAGCITRGDGQRRLFVNGAGVGLDAAVVAGRPSTGGQVWRYAIATLGALRRFRPAPLRVQVDDRVCEGHFLLAYAGIGRYAGGGMRLAPHAGTHDGRLHLTLVNAAHPARIAALLPALYRGTLHRSTLVNILHGERITIDGAAAATAAEADGEWLGPGPQCLQILPAYLTVIAAKAAMGDNPRSLHRNARS